MFREVLILFIVAASISCVYSQQQASMNICSLVNDGLTVNCSVKGSTDPITSVVFRLLTDNTTFASYTRAQFTSIGQLYFTVNTPQGVGQTLTQICLSTYANGSVNPLGNLPCRNISQSNAALFEIVSPLAGDTNVVLKGMNFRTYSGPDNNNIEFVAPKSLKILMNTNPDTTLPNYPSVNGTIITEDADGVVIKSGKNYAISALTIDGGTYNSKLTLSFIPPTIKNVTVDATKTTLTGISFGGDSLKSKLKLTFDVEDVAAKITSVTTDTIVLTNPSNILTAGARKFNIDLDSNPGTPYTYTLNPVVSTVSSVPTGGGLITISGKYLALTRGDGKATVSNIQVGTKVCTAPTNLADGRISCTIESGSGGGHAVKVTIDGAVSQEAVTFSYGRPQMTSYLQGGLAMTVTGTSLGSVATTKIFINGLATAVTISSAKADGSELTFTLPLETRNGYFTIQVGDLVSNQNEFTLAPVLTSVTKSDTPGSAVTIVGNFLMPQDFGSKEVSPQRIQIDTLINCKDPIFAQNQTICKAPEGAGQNYNLTVSFGTRTSNPVPFSYNPPKLVDYYQIHNTIYLKGSNFGKFGSAQQVKVQDEDVTHTTTQNVATPHSDTSFLLFANSSDSKLTIVVQGQESNELSIAVRPSIESITPVPTKGGLVTVKGYFIAANNPSVVSFTVINGVTCTGIIPFKDNVTQQTGFTCEASNGFGIENTATLVISNITTPVNDPLVNITYIAPTITSVSNTTEEGGSVTIVGDNYHPSSILVKIGVQTCQSPQVSEYNTVVCQLDKWDFDALGEIPNTRQNVTITVGNQIVNNELFSYDLEALYERRREEEKKKKLKWLIPAIVVPCVVGVALIVAVSIILVKKHNKNQELKKMFGK
ncbi:immunoglobulin E-set domain-containing protein [Cavenderia fasciculata]|uniref:Immunoglobulin E-set domain-containing protein n=1 Tax=Cavenderia fasciculata TaxID=261658 RepID=F4Q9B5_CACFS|nr:immunoglobulin E-set domain-containing protein [Cavenderia fasciculata]EGG15284.1 immunoglobulin E-set domain-containing protein [Cavenderia fasciculata]|eukprot:XP_004352004.1 immunoglobulin E-set domain-containing protein [Cavenderia fasciculata]